MNSDAEGYDQVTTLDLFKKAISFAYDLGFDPMIIGRIWFDLDWSIHICTRYSCGQPGNKAEGRA